MKRAALLEAGGSLSSRLEAKDLLPNASSPEIFRDAPQASPWNKHTFWIPRDAILKRFPWFRDYLFWVFVFSA